MAGRWRQASRSSPMPRYCITVEYDGTPFVGWQRQDNGPSVQQSLEEALAAFTFEKVHVQASGRTDAGVHARGQVAHFDLSRDWLPQRLVGGLNHYLRDVPVAVLACRPVPADFHARFSCLGRRYLYRIINRRGKLALDAGHAWLVPQALDADAMHRAAQHLIGLHDFTSFRAAHCQADSPLRTLDRLDVRRVGEEIEIHAAARSFLYHQVRNMVGTLSLVGLGKWQEADVVRALAARNRAAGGPTAPAHGLHFMAAWYDPESAGS